MAVSAAQWQRDGRDGHAKLGQFAVNAPVTPERVLVRQAYRIRPAFRRSTPFSCRSASNSAFFAWSPRTTRTVTLKNQPKDR